MSSSRCERLLSRASDASHRISLLLRSFSRLLCPAPRAQIPKKGISEYGTCQCKLAPLLEDSACVTIEMQLPLGLNAEPQDGKVVVTKDGAGGEKEGDILR